MQIKFSAEPAGDAVAYLAYEGDKGVEFAADLDKPAEAAMRRAIAAGSFKGGAGQVVEIETEIAAADFERLWTQRRESLQKARYSWPDGRFHWDVDFFKTDDGRTYFAMAEVEMPENDTTPPPLAARLAPHFLAEAPHRDPRFTSKRLSDPVFAEALLAGIRAKGGVE